MYDEAKHALDGIFAFMIVVSIALFLLSLVIDIAPTILTAVKGVDIAVLAGYYSFFFIGLYHARTKAHYVRKHWILVLLLLTPILPVIQLLRVAMLQRAFGIGVNTLWHFLNKAGRL